MLISYGVPPIGGVKQGRGWEKQAIFELNASISQKRLEIRLKLHKWLIVSRTWAFDWHQGRWPWMTLNCYKFQFSWKVTTAKRIEINPHCQRQNCGPQNVLFIDV